MVRRLAIVGLLLLTVPACSSGPDPAGVVDVGANDTGVLDASLPDASDAGTTDTGVLDTSVPDPRLLDVNDVSVLFPLPGPGQPASLLLGLGSAGKGGVLLSPDHFSSVIAPFLPLPDPVDYGSWSVVAFRFDPCGIDVVDGPCVAQLRLVAQPLISFDADAQAIVNDQGLHLIYAIDPASVPAIERDLRALKAASPAPTSGQPLGVHPGLAAAGLDSAYARQVESFVLSYVGEPSLVRIATTFTNGFGSWTFTASTVDAGVLSPITIAGTAGTQIGLTPIPVFLSPLAAGAAPPAPPALDDGGFLDGGFLDDGGNPFLDDGGVTITPPGLTPIPIGTDSVELFVLGPGSIADASDGDYQEAINAALRLENPNDDDVFHVDCASCHMASRELTGASSQRPFTTTGNPNLFVPPRGVTSGFTLQEDEFIDGYFTKAFSYFGSQPSFIVRTVNESAQIAAQLNAGRP
jgi:hypothetical protein